jgi:hypothetical protein
MSDSKRGYTKMVLFALCEIGLKTYPHADAKQRKTLL